MQHTFDTVKIITGNKSPAISSAKRIPKDDWELMKQAARALVGHGLPNAALGMPLPSGVQVIMRRVRDTQEVRGILVTSPFGKNFLLALLGNDPFWATPAFTLARRGAIDLRDDRATVYPKWVHNLDRIPPGFTTLDAPGTVGPSSRQAVASTDSGPAQVDARFARPNALPQALPGNHVYPPWINIACGAATIASMIFLAVAILLTTVAAKPSRPGERGGTGASTGATP